MIQGFHKELFTSFWAIREKKTKQQNMKEEMHNSGFAVSFTKWLVVLGFKLEAK